MYTKSKCKIIRRRASKMNERDIEEQLETCQKCAYRNKVEHYKDETYKQVRLAYVKSYEKTIRRLHNL